MTNKSFFYRSMLAGVLIALASCIYVNCENKIVGALLFSLGLICVCVLSANLYTGKIGYVNSKELLIAALWIFVINILSAYIIGSLMGICSDWHPEVFESRLSKSMSDLFFDSVICGMCIYLGVEGYKKTKNIIILVLAVMAFILSGAEHVVADAAYLGMGGIEVISFKSILYLFIIGLGNSVGSLILRFLQLGGTLKCDMEN